MMETIRELIASIQRTTAVQSSYARVDQISAALVASQVSVAKVLAEVEMAQVQPALAVRIVCPVCTKLMWSGMCRSGGDLRNANWTAIEPHLRKHVAEDGVATATVTVEVMVDL